MRLFAIAVKRFEMLKPILSAGPTLPHTQRCPSEMEGSETVAVVPSESWRHRPIKVEVHALLSNGTSQLPTASSSSKSSNEHCLASKGLWNQLEAERRRLRGHSTHINGNDAESGWNDLDEVIGIAVELPTDRRLNRKGKGRALVVWVERDDRGNVGPCCL